MWYNKVCQKKVLWFFLICFLHLVIVTVCRGVCRAALSSLSFLRWNMKMEHGRCGKAQHRCCSYSGAVSLAGEHNLLLLLSLQKMFDPQHGEHTIYLIYTLKKESPIFYLTSVSLLGLNWLLSQLGNSRFTVERSELVCARIWLCTVLFLEGTLSNS